MKNRISLLILLAISFSIHAQKVMRIGIIGLDTSHSTAFTELINSGSDETFSKGFRVVAAYPYGSKTIQSSYERIPGYIEKVKANGVEITSSIADLLEKVDCVLLETNDGRLHLEQAVEVFKSGKICYIDKPVGATLGDAIAIYEMAEKYNAPVFSSSALRFTPQNQKLRNGEFGKILGADCYSPHKVEPTHPDFGFYGIHGVETLYTIMGTGCESVNRMSSDRGDVVVGRWKDGRIGTFRAIIKGPQIYGGTAYTSKGAVAAGGYQGYKALLEQILKYFQTGISPISREETIEIFTFMKASNMSKEENGRIVTLEEAYQSCLTSDLTFKRQIKKRKLSPNRKQYLSLWAYCDQHYFKITWTTSDKKGEIVKQGTLLTEQPSYIDIWYSLNFHWIDDEHFIVESNYKGLISDTWEVDISNGAVLATCWF